MSQTIEHIKKLFPKAEPFDQVLQDYYTKMLRVHGLLVENTLAAVSVCPDELNNQVVKQIGRLFGAPFLLGGLAGFPFSGESGFSAFGDHIPDGGTGVIFFGPHVGINEHQPLGYIKRRGQQRSTVACDSLLNAYHEITGTSPSNKFEDDYQQEAVKQMLTDKLHLIPNDDPELPLLDLLFDESHDFIVRQANRIKGQFNLNGVVLLGAIIINTPADIADCLDVRCFEVI